MKKRILLSILILLIVTATVACQPSTTDTSSAPPVEQSADTSSEAAVSTDPLREANFSDRDFTILQRTERKYEFSGDETASALINDQIAERNRLVEERYNVQIKTIEVDGEWAVWNTFTQYVDDTVRGGLVDFDLVSGYAVSMPTLVSKDVFVNWYDLSEYMNLDAEWWYQDFIDQMSIGGNLYMISGDMSLTMWESMLALFFNKTMVADNPNIPDLYQVVRDREWTYDKFLTTLKDAYPNETGVTADDRIYSFATFTTTQIDVWQDAFNIPVTEKDAEGKPKFVIGESAKMVDTVGKIYDLTKEPFTYVSTVDVNDTLERFGKGKSCFVTLNLGSGTALKNYQVDYGILPLPMYDETQEKYNTTCQDFYSVFSVPITSVDDLEFVGTLTEALCYYSNKVVVPEYYDIVLKLRNTFDAESAEMIDIIRDGVLCNFGYLYSMALDWPAHQMNVLINADSRDWVSNWQGKEGTFNANLEKELVPYFKK